MPVITTEVGRFIDSAVNALLAKTKAAAANGKFELFKTSQHFDSTAKHPEWLGGESPQVQHVGKDS